VEANMNPERYVERRGITTLELFQTAYEWYYNKEMVETVLYFHSLYEYGIHVPHFVRRYMEEHPC